MLPAPTPFVVGRGTDGFPEGCPDMMTGSKDDWRSSRKFFFALFHEAELLSWPLLHVGECGLNMEISSTLWQRDKRK